MKTEVYPMRKLFDLFEELPDSDLVTREMGVKAYGILKEAMLQTALRTLLVFDFADVLVMDSSFAGPSLLRLMRELIEGKYGDKYLALCGATPSTKENIDLTIRGHGLKFAVPLFENNDRILLLGHVEPSLRDTFEMIGEQKTLTARDLADPENIGISAASNRLKRLYDLRLITRIEEVTSEGRQYRYRSLMV